MYHIVIKNPELGNKFWILHLHLLLSTGFIISNYFYLKKKRFIVIFYSDIKLNFVDISFWSIACLTLNLFRCVAYPAFSQEISICTSPELLYVKPFISNDSVL